MNRIPLSIPEIAFISGTRGMIGAGLALLLADRHSAEQRRAVGWTLFGIGALTTVPIAIGLFKAKRITPEELEQAAAGRLGERDLV